MTNIDNVQLRSLGFHDEIVEYSEAWGDESEISPEIVLSAIQHQQLTTVRYIYTNDITKTRLYKYIENFTTKILKFSDKISDIFHISAQKHRLWVLVRTASSRRF